MKDCKIKDLCKFYNQTEFCNECILYPKELTSENKADCLKEIVEYYKEQSDMKCINRDWEGGKEYILFDIEQILKKYNIFIGD